jgi:hypothetical protein
LPASVLGKFRWCGSEKEGGEFAALFLFMPEEILNLSDALDRVNRVFRDDFHHMDFFFCYKDQKVRTIFNVIRSLPNLFLQVEDEGMRQVVFESTWTNVNNNAPTPGTRVMEGSGIMLRSIPARNPRRANNYFAHSFMGIPLTHQVNIFEYGFEILSEVGIDMIGIKSACLEDGSISYIRGLVGQTVWAIPPVRADVNAEIQHFWRITSHDDFDNFIRRLQRGEKPQPQVTKQKDLIIDEDTL